MKKHPRPRWITNEVVQARETLNLLYDAYKSTTNNLLFEKYKRYKKYYNRLVKTTIKSINDKSINEATNKSKKVWQIINSETKQKNNLARVRLP